MARAFIPTLFNDEDLRPFSSLFDELTWIPFRARGGEVEIYEDEEAVFVEAPVPGLKAEDVKVNLREGVLTISGERKEEKKNVRFHRKLSSKYAFQVALPQSVDESAPVDANLKDGILKVRLAKARSSKPVKIEVKSE